MVGKAPRGVVRLMAFLPVSVFLLCMPVTPPVHAETFLRGDSSEDGEVDLTDVIFTLQALFLDGLLPNCKDAMDVNDDGYVDISEPIYTLYFMYVSGPQPPFPYPRPGIDPTLDGLDCLGISDEVPDFTGIWNGTFIDAEEEYIVVLDVSDDGIQAVLQAGMESVGNAIVGGEIFIADPPGGLYPFGLIYTTTFDEVTFLFDHSPDGSMLSGEFLTTSGTSGFGSLVRVREPFALSKVAGTYQATYYDDDCDAVWGGTVTVAAGGQLSGVYSGGIPIESGSIALAPQGTGALRDIYEGSWSAAGGRVVHFMGYLAADTGIMSGRYEDPGTRNGTFLFEPIEAASP